jgi:benzoyl-CoA reductase/2-hydroxyglutaryl-CoA dehydratase subunit BcrC/BadD/HgdB
MSEINNNQEQAPIETPESSVETNNPESSVETNNPESSVETNNPESSVETNNPEQATIETPESPVETEELNEEELTKKSIDELVKRVIDNANASLDLIEYANAKPSKDDLRYMNEESKIKMIKDQESVAVLIESLTKSLDCLYKLIK